MRTGPCRGPEYGRPRVWAPNSDGTAEVRASWIALKWGYALGLRPDRLNGTLDRNARSGSAGAAPVTFRLRKKKSAALPPHPERRPRTRSGAQPKGYPN